ncbi:hypothetical protein TrVE_jg1623 [Triparma verrucosa]|uniref:Uncharacterized protein n=1 Tax=Triparma verrucosa TaxID=1606542 RepID=A0A9W7F0G2_9STRA|nr:hypothetical protein TrVE_jg1623 [Triparma verrucosa]
MSQRLASSFTALRSNSDSGAFSQQAEQISTTIQDDIDVKTFESVDRWYVFSDLHASSNTIKQTVRTLERLNELVMENEGMNGNKNGIIFLGDFFHSRGSIPVPLLNSLCKTLSKVTAPTIMIPGNHDQITLGGSSHSLTFLPSIMPHCYVISSPQIFLSALWIPYRRNSSIWSTLPNSILPPLKALFVHADVRGAKMTSTYKSNSTLTMSTFPPSTPVYSGHFHLPHSIVSKDRKVTYVGSPYQMSFSEAGDVKRFLVLDEEFRVVEEVPVGRVGREFYIGLEGGREAEEGDIVRLDVLEGEEESVREEVREMKERGVDVVVRRIQRKRNEGKDERDYNGDDSDRNPTMMSDSDFAFSFLGSMNYNETSPIYHKVIDTLNNVTTATSNSRVDLQMGEIDLKGFASFKDKAEYPLDSRGLVLLKGGGASNGVGKTSLAWAAMWALTGMIDSRAINDASVASIINSRSKNATVSLKGLVNGKPFSVVRSKTRTKTSLKFTVDDKDFTMQTAKDTQGVISELCGSYDTLSRCVFMNQFMSGDMLSGSDSDLLAALSKLADIEKFQQARKAASEESRALQKERLTLEGGLSVRSKDEMVAVARVEEMEKLVAQSAVDEADLSAPKTIEINDALEKATAELDRLKEERENDEALSRLRADIESTDSEFRSAKEAVWKSEKEIEMIRNAGVAHNHKDGDSCPTCGQTIEGDAEAHFAESVKTAELKMKDLEVSLYAATQQVGEKSDRLGLFVEEQRNIQEAYDTKIKSCREEVSELRRQISEAVVDSVARDKVKDARAGLDEAKSKVATLTQDVTSMKEEIERLRAEEAVVTTAMGLFSARGIQQYVLKGTFDSLSAYTAEFLSALSRDSLRMELECDEGGKIGRSVEVLENGEWIPRSLGSLSGGQYRRCSLALTFGYREMSRKWGNFKSNLLVLDEPLTHLDTEGRRDVGALLKELVREDDRGTVLCILQDKAAEEMESSVDEIDVVERDSDGGSSVLVDQFLGSE